MGGYEDDLARWLRDADKRERDAQQRHKETLETHRLGYERVTKAIEEGFKVLHDAVLDLRR